MTFQQQEEWWSQSHGNTRGHVTKTGKKKKLLYKEKKERGNRLNIQSEDESRNTD